MHKNHFAHARKFALWLGAALGLLLLSGCDLTITNLTPDTLPENPSQIYTLSARIPSGGSNIVAGSVVPHLIVDGQDQLMKKSPLGGDIYELDYHLPPGRDEFAYYILVNYQIENNGGVADEEAYINTVHVKIAKRYVLSLEAVRGPVGARVNVLGRGFTAQDIVYFDGTPARTVYDSSSSLGFFVPALDADHNYNVTIGGAAGNSPVGSFHIDALEVQVSPAALTLHTGEQQTLTFTVPVEAPAGGLLLDVTTDVPDSVIMPEVVVPAGGSTVTVTVQGGKPGAGSLFLKGYGSGTVTIPVSVQ
jgi:hypothetical protein